MAGKLIVAAGLPLSGKSTLGRAVALRLGVHFCNFDDLRSAAFGVLTREQYLVRLQDPRWPEIKAKEIQRTYRLLHNGVLPIAVADGLTFAFEATYSRKSSQEFLKKVVDEGGAEIRILMCRGPEDRAELERRMQRDLGKDRVFGTMTWEEHAADAKRFEAIDRTGVFPPECILAVDTTAPLETYLEQAVEFVRG
jgi:predicted kinase